MFAPWFCMHEAWALRTRKLSIPWNRNNHLLAVKKHITHLFPRFYIIARALHRVRKMQIQLGLEISRGNRGAWPENVERTEIERIFFSYYSFNLEFLFRRNRWISRTSPSAGQTNATPTRKDVHAELCITSRVRAHVRTHIPLTEWRTLKVAASYGPVLNN